MIIIDASVAVKFINTQEEGSDKALELLRSHIKFEEEIIIPSFLLIEVANALTTKTHVSESGIKEGLDLLYEARFTLYEVGKEEIEEASMLSRKYKTSVYDMLYAIIAKTHNITLITADKRFVEKVDFSFVKLLVL